MTTMAAVGLPVRKFEVELIQRDRAHFYQVTLKDGRKEVFPGVTGKLSVINKPLLVPWAANQGIARAIASTVVLLGGAKPDEVEKAATAIANRIKDAKKSAGKGNSWATALAGLLEGDFKLKKKSAKLDHAVLSSIIESASKAPDQAKDAAADLGTRAHAIFDKVVKGEEVKLEDVPEDIRTPVKSFLDWLKESGIQMVMGDTRVASLKDKFGGSLDALGWKDGRYILLDWKTSNGIYDEYALQVAAYAQAFEETFGVRIGEAHIVRFGKTTPDFEHKELANLTVSYGAFDHASQLQSLLKDYSHFKGQDDGEVA